MELPPKPLAQQKQKLYRLLKRHLKSAKKYLIKCNQLLEEAHRWQEMHHEAELLSAYHYLLKRGPSEVQLPDWEQGDTPIIIHLNPEWTPQEEILFRFKKSKKLKKGIAPLTSEKERAEKTLQKVEAQLRELEAIQTEEGLTLYQKGYSIENRRVRLKESLKLPPLPYYEFFSESGIPIWVGKNSKGNDQLTFRFAHGNDEWMHVAEYPGSHVVLHHQGKGYDESAFQDALQLALFYSKGRDSGRCEINITKKKNVTRLGRTPGKVQISKHKTMLISLDQVRIQKIRTRSKP